MSYRNRTNRIGERLRFIGTREHWGPDLTENAEADLDLGEIYTLREMMVYSSYTTITLEETYSTYSLTFFEHVVSEESMLLGEGWDSRRDFQCFASETET